MAEVFSQVASQFGGAISPEGVEMTFVEGGLPGNAPVVNGIGLLVQQLQLAFQQQFARFYELSSRRVYYVAGRAAGQSSLNRVVGPQAVLEQFYDTFGSVCRAAGNSVSFRLKNRCATGPNGEDLGQFTGSYLAKFCVLTQIGINGTAQDLVVNETSNMEFSALHYSDG